MAKKKKRKLKKALLMLCIIGLCIYGGIKGGEFLAVKLQKPVGEESSALSGANSSGKTGIEYKLTENDMVSLTSLINEFLNAEHKKKDDALSLIVDHNYYNTLLKENKALSTGNIVVQDINFKEMSAQKVIIEATYIKNSKNSSETITLDKVDKSWKVTKVER